MNKKTIGALLAVVVVAVLATGFAMSRNTSNHEGMAGSDMATSQNNGFAGKDQDKSVDTVQSGQVKMDIADFAFTQKTLKIKKGTTVTWTNQDSAKHDVAPDAPSPDFEASKLLSKGESYSFTFDKPGTYAYHCTPHPYMKASVEVVE